MLAAGARLGRYSLVRPLGRGGMGEVWEAVLLGPEGFRKPVAIKVLVSGPSGGRARDALLREARLGALLSHPSVATTYALGCAGDTWYVAMELVRGPSLRDLLRASGPLSPAAVLEVGVQACAGLAHAHGLRVDGVPQPIVHRDVKPGNLLVEPSGLVKLVDLGIAALGAARRPRLGTPGFAAPEQLSGLPEDHRVDVFGLGATLWALVTGLPPSGGSAPLVDRRVPGLGSILARSVEDDPDARWPTMSELGDALAALRGRRSEGATLAECVAATGHHAGRGAAWVPSPGIAPAARADGLPVARGRFVGRPEAGSTTALLRRGERLVTLVGLGGAGKTRLATECARELARDLPGGVRFVDLSEARTLDEACRAVARGLGTPLRGTDPVAQLGHALAARGRALFVLDNLEQLAEDAKAAIGRWAEAATEATFLCTSRVALRLRGEACVPVSALSTADGVALFHLRRGVRADEDDVAAIVQAVEGLPLAIELAASRARLRPVAEVRARLAEGLRVLDGGPADAPERHRSIVASLDGSWELLSPPARAALAQATVFEGRFLVDAAEAVLDVPDALDAIEELCAASLLRLDPDDGRFSMHALVRTYAESRLDAASRRTVEGRHGAYFAQLGSREALERNDEQTVDELTELIAACRRASARGDPDVAVPALSAALGVLEMRGPTRPAVTLAELVAAMPGLTSHQRARVAHAHGAALHGSGRTDEAFARFEAARSGSRACGDLAGEGQALRNLGNLLAHRGQGGEARAHFEAALRIHRATGNRRSEGMVLGNMANVDQFEGRLADAERRYGDALTAHRAVGNRRSEGVALGNLGGVYRLQGRLDDAEACFVAALRAHREVRNAHSEAVTLGNLGLVHLQSGRLARAAEHLEEALRSLAEIGDPRAEGSVLANLADVHVRQGDLEGGQARYERALALVRGAGDRRTAAEVLGLLGALDARLGRPATARERLEEALALHREVANRREEGNTQGELAALALAADRPDEAAARCDAAIEILREVGDPRAEGHVTVLRARCAPAHEALALLDRAEQLLRRAKDRAELAACLAARAEACARAGRREAALGALAEAQATAPPDHADAAEAIARARRVVS